MKKLIQSCDRCSVICCRRRIPVTPHPDGMSFDTLVFSFALSIQSDAVHMVSAADIVMSP